MYTCDFVTSTWLSILNIFRNTQIGVEELETSAHMVNHGTKVGARHNRNSQCRMSRYRRTALPCGSLAVQLSRQDQAVGHLADALACLEVGDLLDADASQVDRLDGHNRDGLQGIQVLQAAACPGNLGVEVHLGSPVAGHLA